jgi:hypothetical protein
MQANLRVHQKYVAILPPLVLLAALALSRG